MMNLLAHFVNGNAHVFGIPLNVFMEFIVPALAVPFLILFKYGRPRGYLTDLRPLALRSQGLVRA